MPILNQRIFNELDQERVICITGALSGGKSRLAFDIALNYWRMGFRILSNVPHNFVSDTKDTFDLFKTYVIVDEGGEYVRQSKMASAITRSAGKANYYMIFAGKRLPHKELQTLIIRPRFDFYQNYGIPLILWRATVLADEKYKFPIWQYIPQVLHGTYSTLTSSGGIESILARAENTVNLLAQMEGQTAGKTNDAGIAGFAEDIAEGVSSFIS